jgi:putative membrane protein
MKVSNLFIIRTTAALVCSLLLSAPVLAQQNAKLSDAEIASVAVVANQVDIDAAKLAQNKSKNTEVQNFAKTMISDHQSVIDKATALVQKLGVTPKDNALSQQLSSNATKTKESLQAKSGKAFDKAYIDNEVAYHQAVISTVQDRLIPDAQNNELKNLLQSILPVLKTHLEHAKMVQKNVL